MRTCVIGDVANVQWDSQPLIGDAVINDGPGMMLIVQKLPWANTLDVTRGVDEAMKDLGPGLEGMQLTRQSSGRQRSSKPRSNLTEALYRGLLVILILVLFLFEWRTALISVVAIPLSLMAAALVLLTWAPPST